MSRNSLKNRVDAILVVYAAWYVSLFLVTRIIRPTLMIRNMRSTQNINICYGSGVPVPLTRL